MSALTKTKLSFMMFLEFFIWGGWFVTMGTFLSQAFNASGAQLAQAYETQSIGAIIAPFIIGLIDNILPLLFDEDSIIPFGPKT